MTGKDILLAALRNRPTPRVPWLPFVGVHGGHLIGSTASDYLMSDELVVRGLLEAVRRYRPDGLPVMFDLQLEAEILGCDLRWSDDTPPAVSSHPFAGGIPRTFPVFDPAHGRFPVVRNALRRLHAEIGGEVALLGLVTGPFTLALHLLGHEIFLMMFDEEDEVRRLLAFCAECSAASAAFYLDHGADAVAVVDPMTSQISPAHFAAFAASAANRAFQAIRERGAPSSLFVCGDATRNLEAMCRTGCDNLCIDENISLESLRTLALRESKSFGGNLKLTTVLLLGTPDDARRDALRCLDTGGDLGFVLAPGCDLPYAVPPANLEAVAEMVHDPYRRNVARTTLSAPPADTFDDLPLPDYPALDFVTVDVITLDSSSCAPCQYMMEAVQQAAKTVQRRVHVEEHRIKTRAGIGRMHKLGVGNLPTICIDGEIAFISVIPDQPTLVQAIERHAQAKAAR